MNLQILIIILLYIGLDNSTPKMKVPLDGILIEQTDHLIEKGTTYDLEALDSIYSPELRIVRLDKNNQVTVIDKAGNMAFFRSKRESGAVPLSQKTKYHYAERKGDRGYVFLTRIMKLSECWEELKYHIEWELIEGRWQVTHENVFAQPLKIK